VLTGCLLALVLIGCGSSDVGDARGAAQAYTQALGRRDGTAVCAHMTTGLQQRFASSVTLANPGLTGECPKLMQAALNSVPPAQLGQFATAKIVGVQITGDTGSFTYAVKGGAKVDGRVAKQDGSWKVSCCVPGQGG
jgi:hypothetical protein